ncbi:MAG: hypothetical protein KDD47_27925, partial [Acidobacteria bacterium]|nr:hypothetical protein [Acidobacteriota bacterium]
MLVLAVAPLSSPAHPQQFGQWWWEASVQAGGRSFDNRVEGATVSEFRQQDLTLSLGINGYIIHPAVARFRLGYDLLFSEVEGGRSLDTDRSGYQADLGVFPNGSYSLDLSFKRQVYDYAGFSQEEPLTLLGVPDRTTSWRARLRARRGRLKGLLLGFESSSFQFLDEKDGDEVQDLQFADWSSAGRKLNHHVRMEHQARDFGRVDLRFDDLIVNWDEHGDLGERWRWDFSAIGMDRSVQYQMLPETRIGIYRLLHQLVRTNPEGDALTLSYNGGLSDGTGNSRTDSHSLGARYQWRRHRSWQVAAFGDVALQRSAGSTLRTPQAGVALSWRRRVRGVDVGLNGGSSYRLIDREG